jgi:WD40 repeat protein
MSDASTRAPLNLYGGDCVTDQSTGAGAQKSRVFLSYSRKDKKFTLRLAQALIDSGHVVDFDESDADPSNVDTGISAEDDWWQRLQEMNAASESMVFIVSPDSASSRVCDEEIAYARALGKRVIPILVRPINYATAPPRLSALNVKISFVEETQFAGGVSALARALDVDVNWHREGARLMYLASKWDGQKRPDSQLLPSGAIVDAEAWAGRRPPGGEPPGEPLLSFLDASSAKARQERERLLTITGRAFVPPADRAFAEGRYDTALRLAAAGIILGEDVDLRLVPERAQTALLSASALSLRAVFELQYRYPKQALFIDDASLVVTAAGAVGELWSVATGEKIATLEGHSNSLSGAAVSPDGRHFLTYSAESVRIWDLAGKFVCALTGPSFASAAFDPAGQRIVTGSYGRIISVWDALSGREERTFSTDLQFGIDATFSPDGLRLLCVSHDRADILDADSGGVHYSLKLSSDHSIMQAAFSPDGRSIYTVANYQYVTLWDAETGQQRATLRGHQNQVRTVRFAPDGRLVLTASEDATIRLWDADNGQLLRTIEGHEAAVQSAAFSTDGARIVTASSDQSVRIWDAASGLECVRLHAHDGAVANAAFSAQGDRIISRGAADGTVRVWDASLGYELMRAQHYTTLYTAAFSPDDRSIATSSSGVQVWDAASGKRTAMCVAAGGQSAEFSPDGKSIVAGSLEADVSIIDAQTGGVVRTLPTRAAHAGYSPDGKRIITSNEKSCALWEVNTGSRLLSLEGHVDSVRRASFSSDGRRIATASFDKTVRIWDAADGRQLLLFGEHKDPVEYAYFSSDGERVVSSHDGLAYIWNASSGSLLATLRSERLNGARFSPDDVLLITGGVDAHVWDGQGRKVAVLDHRGGYVGSVAFSHDGARIVTTSEGELRIWDARAFTLLATNVSETVAALLTAGRGKRTAKERDDILLQSVEEDDLSALLAHRLEIASPGAAGRIATLARNLNQLPYPSTYAPPSKRNGWELSHCAPYTDAALESAAAPVANMDKDHLPDPLLANCSPRCRIFFNVFSAASWVVLGAALTLVCLRAL